MGSSKKFLISLVMIPIMLHNICSIATCAYYYSQSHDTKLPSFRRSDIAMSMISASPALLPYPPEVPPPDITPLFPSPGSGSALSPSESSLPIIPSSTSPPDPTTAYRPDQLSISPTTLLPESSVPAQGRSWLLMAFLVAVVVVVG
ncbi:hypothetical protein Droror1_Dr00008495 [Drosera rotundifolia]